MSDLNSKEFFNEYSPIPSSEDEILRKLSIYNLDKMHDVMKTALVTRLKPGSSQGDVSALIKKSISATDYLSGLGDRLITISCSKAGGRGVFRGMMKSGMLCRFTDKIDGIVKTGKRQGEAENRRNVYGLRFARPTYGRRTGDIATIFSDQKTLSAGLVSSVSSAGGDSAKDERYLRRAGGRAPRARRRTETILGDRPVSAVVSGVTQIASALGIQ